MKLLLFEKVTTGVEILPSQQRFGGPFTRINIGKKWDHRLNYWTKHRRSMERAEGSLKRTREEGQSFRESASGTVKIPWLKEGTDTGPQGC